MPGTPTTRLSLPTINGATDSVSSYPSVNLTQMSTLDAAVTVTEGTLVDRPAGSYVGQTYYATDTALWYFYDGSAWQTVMRAEAWQDFASIPNTSDTQNGAVTPQFRLLGDEIEFTGSFKNISGAGYPPDQVIAYLTAGLSSSFSPTGIVATQQPSNGTVLAATVTLAMASSKLALIYAGPSASWPTGASILLDSLRLRIA